MRAGELVFKQACARTGQAHLEEATVNVNGRERSDAETCLDAARDAYVRAELEDAYEHLMGAVVALSEQSFHGDERELRIAIYSGLGHVFLRLERFTDALLAYGVAAASTRAKGDRDRAVRIAIWMGEAYRRAGKDHEAEVRWREAVRDASALGAPADPLRTDALRRLAAHLESRGRAFEAERIRKLVGYADVSAEPPFE